MRTTEIILWAITGLFGVASIALVVSAPDPASSCGFGFVAVLPRCCVSRVDNRCSLEAKTCPAPLVHDDSGSKCIPADSRVLIPETTVLVGPSDWEAEGRVAPRTLHVASFSIDAFELSDAEGRAKNLLSRDEAAALCQKKKGRLPTNDEWTIAAAGPQPRRYPWGDTGSVCRRGAWGIENGPCAHGGNSPDTVGSHADGDTPNGIHDLAGNVAEWVSDSRGIVRGGSFRSTLATEMRTWSEVEIDPSTRESWIGARCAYDEERAIKEGTAP